MQTTADSALLRQFAETQSDEAFAVLVTRHINLVYSVALRQAGNPGSAEEITQAVFIILARKAAQLRHDKALSSWLFQTTRLTASNIIRSESRRHRREEEAYMQSAMNEAGTEVWPRIAPLLDCAVADLREKDRRAIVLRYYEGRNLREVGLALGASEDAAGKRVNRALEKLRKFFTKRGVSSTTAFIAVVISANSIQAAPAALIKTTTAVAIAKGATASASTLTLIKGALKIMAWTKAKTAIVVGAGILLAAGTVTVQHHLKARDAWRTPNVTTQMVRTTPSQIRILPTKFPGGNEVMRMDDSLDKFVGINVTVANMFGMAYRDGNVPMPAQRIVFNTAEPQERYDFAAILPHGATAALQRELKSKLGYVARLETRDAAAGMLQLRVRRPDALQRKLTTGKMGNISGSAGSGPSSLKCENQSLSTIANVLGQMLNATVVDQTDLTGQYSFELTWNEFDGKDPHHDAMKRALMDQLGLELAPDHEPVEMLVVEKAK